MGQLFKFQRTVTSKKGMIHSLAKVRYPFLSFNGTVYYIFKKKTVLSFSLETFSNEDVI